MAESIMQDREIWKDVKDTSGKYQVSNMGNIRSTYTYKTCYIGNKKRAMTRINRLKEIIPLENGNGYLYVTLHIDGNRSNRYVHRLVAEAFIGNPHNKTQVNHLDYDTRNNAASNLEWCTPKENANYSNVHKHKQKPYSETNTGYRYITKRPNGVYRVVFLGKEKYFRSLNDAIVYRDRRAHEINYTV